MSDYFDFPPEEYNPQGDENPFLGFDGWDETAQGIDPYEIVEQEVLEALGIESFDNIFIEPENINPDELRGNRFSSITEAVIYLFDAGILQFSGVSISEDEIVIEVDDDSGKRPAS